MKVIFIILSLFMLTSCLTNYPQRAKVKIPGTIDVEVGGDSNNGGKFCPPGQAKKGNC